MADIKKTPYYSWRIHRLAKGCDLCVQGRKLVLFITGLCGKRCPFCPVSDQKIYKDVIYANEVPITDFENDFSKIIEETKLCEAKGAGITGGDPLVKLDRVCGAIIRLKKEFGKEFHIHLYTPLDLVDETKLKKLFDSGLDEIRFHVDVDDKKHWEKIKLAKKFSWDVGVEIPVIPWLEEHYDKFLDFVNGKIDFLNLNELEVADNKVWQKTKEQREIVCKDDMSYAVEGSEILAMRILERCKELNMRAHYCTCKLKDAMQMANRIKLRAKNIKKPYQEIDDEGMLVFGVIKLTSSADREVCAKRIMLKSKIPKEMIAVEGRKIHLHIDFVEKVIKRKIPEIIEVGVMTKYPTYDGFVVEYDPLYEK